MNAISELVVTVPAKAPAAAREAFTSSARQLVAHGVPVHVVDSALAFPEYAVRLVHANGTEIVSLDVAVNSFDVLAMERDERARWRVYMALDAALEHFSERFPCPA